MKQDHNLDDLIIDDIKPAKNKSKSILSIIALLIVLLIMAVIMTRMYIGEDDQNITTVNKNDETMISPELKLDTSDLDNESDKKELDQLSSMMEESLTDTDNNSKKEPSAPAKKQEMPAATQIKPETTQVNEEVSTREKPSVKESVKPAKAPAIAASKAAKKTTEAPVSKPKSDSSTKKSGSSSRFYIQVGSFSKTPSKRFLSVITKNGFHYQLKGGKLLVGPYKSDAAARSDLPSVRNKINKSAFIKHF